MKFKGLAAAGVGGVIVVLGIIGAAALVVIIVVSSFLSQATGGVATMIADDEVSSSNGCVALGAGGNYQAMTANKTEYVRTIIGVGKHFGVSEKGQIVAIMVTLQESSLMVYANSGKNHFGYDIGAGTGMSTQYWLDMAKLSLDMPHDAVGNDADSVGLYQQRASARWADTNDGFSAKNDGKQAISRLMNPAFSTMAFYGAGNTVNQGLMDIPGWESMSPTVAAQKVQGSAFPDAYAKWESQASDLYKANKDAPAVDPSKGSSSSKKSNGSTISNGNRDSSIGADAISIPMNEGTYTFTSGFGYRNIGIVSGQDVSNHTGQDMAAPLGTPFYAPADGVVVAAGLPTGKIEDGTWLVIDHDIKGHKYSTLYAHMPFDGIYVQKGDQVKKGQKIGVVGSTGWSTGAHLHFEVWDGGRLTGGHPVDPKTIWDGSHVSGNDSTTISTSGACSSNSGTQATSGEGKTVKISGDVKKIINIGKSQLNVPYSWGGGSLDGPSAGFGAGADVVGFDCSSLMRYMIYQGTGYTLPRTAAEQYTATKGNVVARPGETDLNKLQPGDLLFWGTSEGGIHHVAMYIGDGKLLEALNPSQGIMITDAASRITGDYFGATRINYGSQKA